MQDFSEQDQEESEGNATETLQGMPTVPSQKRLSTNDRDRKLRELFINKKVRVTTLRDLRKMMEDEEHKFNKEDFLEGDRENLTRRKVKVRTLKIIDEMTDYSNGDKPGKGNTNNIPTHNSYMKISTNTMDVQTFSSESMHSAMNADNNREEPLVSLKVVNVDGEGNLKRKSQDVEKMPAKFRKESTIKTAEKLNDGATKRDSKGFFSGMGSNKIAPLGIEDEKKKERGSRPSLLTSGTLTLAGNVIRKSSTGYTSSSAFLKLDKKTELKMNYLVLYKDFKQNKPQYAYYLVLDLIRHILFAGVLVFMFKHPYPQIIIITCLNSTMVLYLILVRPFSMLKDIIQNTVNELMVTICCGSCSYLAYLDKIGDFDLEKRMTAGWIIHYVNMILMFFFTAIFFVELLFAIKEIIPKAFKMIRDKIRRARSKRNKKKNSVFPGTEFTLNTQQN